MDASLLLFERVVVAASPVILDFISTRDARSLRLTSRLFSEVTTAHRWDDASTKIECSVFKWRVCFPRARTAALRRYSTLTDADFVALAGLRRVMLAECRNIMDAHFVHFWGIHNLDNVE